MLANYNYVDIASGTGYITFYAGETVDLKILSNNTFYSDEYVTSDTASTTGYVAEIDLDFDVELNRPLDLKGLGIVNIPVYAVASTYLYVVVTLRKWNGTTETDIATNTSRIFNPSATGYTMLGVDLTIPLTHFKKGETIRLTTVVWAKHASPPQNIKIAYDPKSRTTDWDATAAVPSQLLFQCPVRLNL